MKKICQEFSQKITLTKSDEIKLLTKTSCYTVTTSLFWYPLPPQPGWTLVPKNGVSRSWSAWNLGILNPELVFRELALRPYSRGSADISQLHDKRRLKAMLLHETGAILVQLMIALLCVIKHCFVRHACHLFNNWLASQICPLEPESSIKFLAARFIGS